MKQFSVIILENMCGYSVSISEHYSNTSLDVRICTIERLRIRNELIVMPESGDRTQPSRIQRFIQRIAVITPVTEFFAPRMKGIDSFFLKITNGRTTATEFFVAFPTVWVTTRGARTGKPHTVPLIGIREKGCYIVFASNFGRSIYPAWYYNMKANPEVTLVVDGVRISYLAREVNGREREAYWRKALEVYPGFAAYENRAHRGKIPVIILEPNNSHDG